MYSSRNSRTRRTSTAIFSSAGMLISTLKWPELAMIAPLFMPSKWCASSTLMSPVEVMKMSPRRGGFGHRHDTEAVHDRFQRLQRVNLGDDDVGAQPLGPHGDAAAAPAVAADHNVLAGDQHVGGADDAVHGALARAVAVIEQMLGQGIVDGDDREHQLAVCGHRPQADDAGGGFLGAADDAVQTARGAPCAACRPGRRHRPW